MNIRQELVKLIHELSDEQLSALLDLALALQNGKKSVHPILQVLGERPLHGTVVESKFR